MTDQNQREWPTFGDILSELNSLGEMTSTLSGRSATDNHEAAIAAGTARASALVQEHRLEFDAVDIESVDSDLPEDNFELPAQLAPSSIDTTVLETASDDVDTDLATQDQVIEFDTSALEPLDPSPGFDVDQLIIDRGTADDATTAEEDISEEALSKEALSDDEEGWSVLPTDVEDSDSESAITEMEAVEIELPEDSGATTTASGFDPFTGEINWADTDFAEDEPSDAAPTEGGMVFPFTTKTATSTTDESHTMTSADFAPTTDKTWAEIDESATPEGAATAGFDSVATADAIENDLQDLFDLDEEPEENNVVPLHPSSDDNSDAVVGLDTVFDQDNDAEPLQEWVGIDPTDIGPQDPWAHMRPDEDVSNKSGFWSSRPKFFGGDDRKQKKAQREAEADRPREEFEGGPSASAIDSIAPAPSEHPCPSCHAAGQVELTDALGNKVHLNCGECGQRWTQDLESNQRSA